MWEQRGLQGNEHSFIYIHGWFMYKDNTHLPDMAVGCFVKGAYVMSPTFCLFLEEDNHYNAIRASLMFAATMACVLSIDSEVVSATMGEGYNINVKSSPSREDLVWPV